MWIHRKMRIQQRKFLNIWHHYKFIPRVGNPLLISNLFQFKTKLNLIKSFIPIQVVAVSMRRKCMYFNIFIYKFFFCLTLSKIFFFKKKILIFYDFLKCIDFGEKAISFFINCVVS